MTEPHYKFLLIVLQYVSIVTSGTLGILGLYVDYKDKKTGKLSRWGRIAGIVLIGSFILGIASKTIEVKLESDKEQSDAFKARTAAEQTLKIVKNTERVANAVTKVEIGLNFAISFDSYALKKFKPEILRRYPESNDDRDFSIPEFKDLLPGNKEWQRTAWELTYGQPVVLIIPKDSTVQSCIIQPISSVFENENRTNGITFNFPMEINKISYPDQEQRFLIDDSRVVVPQNSPAVLSLLDFEGATVIVYMFNSSKLVPTADPVKNPGIQLAKSAGMAWDECSVDFRFDGGKQSAYILHMKRILDKCSHYPYYTGKLSLKH